MPKKHATAYVDRPDCAVCGEPVTVVNGKAFTGSTARGFSEIDNANPDCKRCLRSILALIRKAGAK